MISSTLRSFSKGEIRIKEKTKEGKGNKKRRKGRKQRKKGQNIGIMSKKRKMGIEDLYALVELISIVVCFKGNAIVSEIVSRYLFGMKDGEGKKIIRYKYTYLRDKRLYPKL